MWWPFGSSNDRARGSIPSRLEEREHAAAQPSSQLPTPIKQELSREEQASLDFAELLKEIEIEQAKSQDQRAAAKKDGRTQSTPLPAGQCDGA